MKGNDKNNKNQLTNDLIKKKKNKKFTTTLTILTAVLSVTTLGFAVGFGIEGSQKRIYRNNLENVYESNFYSLVDSVNNLDNKLSKTIISPGVSFQRKTLIELSQNASEAEIAIASLPLEQEDINDTIKMVNQISGYSQILAEKLAMKKDLTIKDMQTLRMVRKSVQELKNQLNRFANFLGNGISIIDSNMDMKKLNTNFAKMISYIKDANIEYPTMIYDGPFSDSESSNKVVGLTGKEQSVKDCEQVINKIFGKDCQIKYLGETQGLFDTYNFNVNFKDERNLYFQITKKGAHILTISGEGKNEKSIHKEIDQQKAQGIALQFMKSESAEPFKIVWSDKIENDIYFNIAPVTEGIVLYPDLVKVKIDKITGDIVGYDATSYFMNHKIRNLQKGNYSLQSCLNRMPQGFEINQTRLVLSPLEFNREEICWEVEAEKEGEIFYLYFNSENGTLENVLKVIKTNNGNLLM